MVYDIPVNGKGGIASKYCIYAISLSCFVFSSIMPLQEYHSIDLLMSYVEDWREATNSKHKDLRLSVSSLKSAQTETVISAQTETYTKVVNDRIIRHRNKLVSRGLTPKVTPKKSPLKVVDPRPRPQVTLFFCLGSLMPILAGVSPLLCFNWPLLW